MSAVEEYFGGLDAATRAAFEHIRDLAAQVVPGVEEGTSYGMAALKYKQKPLLGFRAAEQHLSIFPFSPEVVAAVRDRLEGYDLAKGPSDSPSKSHSQATWSVPSQDYGWRRSTVLPVEAG